MVHLPKQECDVSWRTDPCEALAGAETSTSIKHLEDLASGVTLLVELAPEILARKNKGLRNDLGFGG